MLDRAGAAAAAPCGGGDGDAASAAPLRDAAGAASSLQQQQVASCAQQQQPGAATARRPRRTRALLLTGAEGAGKTTLLNYILKSRDERSVSAVEGVFGSFSIGGGADAEAAGEQGAQSAHACMQGVLAGAGEALVQTDSWPPKSPAGP